MAAVNAESSTIMKTKALSKTSSKALLKSCGKFENRTCSEISFKDFLDFLHTSYQINEAIEGVPDDLSEKVDIDWQNITMNEFISSLLVVKEDSSNLKAMSDNANKINVSEHQKSLTEQSINVPDIGVCDTLEEHIFEKTKDASSEMSEHNFNSDVSDIITNKKNCVAKEIVQKGNIMNGVDHTTKSVPNEEIPLNLKKTPSTVTSGQAKCKLLALGKHSESKRKVMPSKKSVLFDSKVKTTDEENNNKFFENLMKRKLNEVIQEGLLDSILPYVVPKQVPTHPAVKKSLNSVINKSLSLTSLDKSSSGQFSKDKIATNNRRKSTTEVEVEIHVCDEVKNVKRDFRCPQKLLVSKMGYFAEVTTGQKLEDMDISVHCDITIFDWLMLWVKKDSLPENSWPKLDAGNVVPILVSAAFLQMDPLQHDCLKFCHQHMNEIAKTSTNLACLNDSILTRLANLFSNSDVEGLHDKKDKIQSRLYCKLILALTETSPEPARGHFSSLASIYKCGKCDKLILHQLGGHIPCKPSNMKMDCFGNIHGNHTRDRSWNLNDYIQSLRQDLESWRNVYWRLWADCHFLHCGACRNYFPVHQMQWCCHHPEPPQFFTMEHQRAMTFPIGRYPCCGERGYRFEVIKNLSGCQFKEHTPVLDSPRDIEVHKLFMKHHNLIILEPQKLQFPVSNREPGRDEGVSREVLWLDGIELAPPRPRQGLLAKIWETHQKKEQYISGASSRNNSSASSGTNSITNRPATTCGRPPLRKQMSAAEVTSDTGNNPDIDNSSTNDDNSSSSSSSSDSDDQSEESGHAPVRSVTAQPRFTEGHQYFKPTRSREASCQWDPKMSVRSNQDIQREYEEYAARKMATFLARRTCEDSSNLYTRMHSHSHGHHGYHGHSIWNSHIIPQGGIYVRLEREWRETNCHSHGYRGNSSYSRSMSWGISSRPRVRTERR
ncbi:uncharacterized protein KIAA1841 homolog isoform X1 [Zootermopsis nevadensis]|uniref:SANT and BTB domain-containing protein n=1 Tax=Zootermopsis nevadensis TaxID=136037 RepID=A0A067QS25_ZOONE|nr:uncharacterized protein KIAA1841 homolog isoform X1 [Zootermopsis nevadensis]KDR11511.1 hypothetical protein L798_14579 [Zootermopsis nevadensis]